MNNFLFLRNTLQMKNGAPGEIRTPDNLLRRQMLYPAELQAHVLITAALIMVGAEGFEPPASCSQGRRATKLRYTPPLFVTMNSISQEKKLVKKHFYFMHFKFLLIFYTSDCHLTIK
jgi:hypothetical protein